MNWSLILSLANVAFAIWNLVNVLRLVRHQSACKCGACQK